MTFSSAEDTLNPQGRPRGASVGEMEPRPFPYPYRAMLAICSDLDETPDRRVYGEIARFLNTTKTTAMGEGVGLEVGNTIYFDMPPGQFAYWNTDDAGRSMVRAMIRSGHIDCLHSYGDLATTRDHAAHALDELAHHHCRLECWIDHAVAPTNFGADIMQGFGDVPGHRAYHADLTCDFGIRYVWRGRVTSIIGQDRPRSLSGIFDPAQPMASSRTMAKEAVKGILGSLHHHKYAMHGPNDVLRRTWLRDRRPVYEFLRCNPSWAGVDQLETAGGVPEVLTRTFLDRLVERDGVCIFYTHLGKIRDRERPFDDRTVAAFRMLADYDRSGRILVTTTRRLLTYRRAVREVQIAGNQADGGTQINLTTRPSASWKLLPLTTDDLMGMTFYVTDPARTTVQIDGRTVADLQLNPLDQTGRPSVSIPWRRLEFPAL